MSGEKALVPELRFPEFEGAWEKKRLGAFLRRLSERVPANTKIPVYSSSREGLKTQEDYFSDRRLANEGEYGVVPDGAITYRHMSDDLTFRFNRNTLGHSIAVSKEYPVFLTEGMDADYLILWLNFSNAFARFAIQQKLGGTRTRLYFKNLSDWQCPIPSLPEQQKIAAFLDAVAKKITLLTQKREALTDYKRGLMQRLFSGALRFTRPDGSAFPDWEERKLGEVFEVKRGSVLSVSNMSKHYSAANQYPVYSSQTKNKGLIGYYNDYLYEDAITWTTDGANAGEVKFREGKFYCTNVCGVLLSRNGYANACVAEMINRVTNRYVSYVGNPKLMNNVMASIKLPFPHPEEQTKIADALSALDAKIDAVSAQISQMETFKKGLLQKMFV